MVGKLVRPMVAVAALVLAAVCAGVAAPVAGVPEELRGVWMNASATARTGETAEQTTERLASHGFSAVFVNYEANSEPLRALLAACRQHGLQTHLWLFRPRVETKEAGATSAEAETLKVSSRAFLGSVAARPLVLLAQLAVAREDCVELFSLGGSHRRLELCEFLPQSTCAIADEVERRPREYGESLRYRFDPDVSRL